MRRRLLDPFRRILEDINVRRAPALRRMDLSGPLLVVGSAPGSHLPQGFDRTTWHVATINGSQGIARQWGIENPDVTAMMFAHLTGNSRNSPAVRSLLKGYRTGHLMVMGLDHIKEGTAERLREMDYGCDSFEIVTRLQRSKFLREFLQTRYYDLVKSEKTSNGVFMIAYGIACGASPLVISGIAPNTTGHAYNDLGLPRKHQESDAQALKRFLARGYAIYTADPAVSEAFDLPLWKG